MTFLPGGGEQLMPRQESLYYTGTEYFDSVLKEGMVLLEKVGAQALLEELKRSIESDNPEARIFGPGVTEHGAVVVELQWDFTKRDINGIEGKKLLEEISDQERGTCRYVGVAALPLIGEVAICGRSATIFLQSEFNDTNGLNEAIQKALESGARRYRGGSIKDL